jgi:hypothetical protein
MTSTSSKSTVEDASDTKALFTKLFKTRGSKISVSSAPSAGNKLQTAIWEAMVVVLEARKSKSDFSAVYSTPSSLPELTVMEVPSSFANGGNNLLSLIKQIDEEYGVMSGYVQHPSESSFVVLFGQLRPRRAAELKLMATIEAKTKGFYSQRIVRNGSRICDEPWYVSTPDFDTDTFPIPSADLSFALGQKGSMRKKLALASGCIIEYVGEVAFFAGTLEERSRGRDYLRWVLKQLEGEVLVSNYQQRVDVATVPLRSRQAGFVNGNKGRLLRAAEELTGCFCFVARSLQPSDASKPLIIAGLEEARKPAHFALEKYLKEHQNSVWTDTNESASSVEGLKAQIEAILKSGGVNFKKPKEPWNMGTNQSESYVWLAQPCPGAARKYAELFPESDKSEILLTAAPAVKKTNSPKSKNTNSTFVNDAMAFPELGGKRNSKTLPVPVTPEPVKAAVEPVQESAPVVPESPKSVSRTAGIFIDRETNQVWGDWGLGPHGDPEAKKSGFVSSPEARLMGAWK